MKGVIVVNGYYKSLAYTHQVNRLIQEFANQGVKLSIYSNNVPVVIGGGFNIDFAIFFDKDIALAKMMENDGIKVFNSSSSIKNTDNKIKTAIILERYGIKMPKTIPSPLQYNYICDKQFLTKVGNHLGYPVVVKTAQGSLGTGVYLANNQAELVDIDQSIGGCEKLYQQYIGDSRGKSYRVIVIGNKVIAAMQLENSKDFRSNANLGGVATAVELDEKYNKLAKNISKYLKLDYCGIDFFVENEMVLEVNSNAFYKKAEEITKVNIAKAYTDYILYIMGEM